MDVMLDQIRLFYCCVIILVGFYSGVITGAQAPFDQLFPSSCFCQALEVCMRVIADKKHTYDATTASDLCVGRLIRLYDIVGQIETVHVTRRPYPREDLTYMLALVRAVNNVQKDLIVNSRQAAPLFFAIEKRLVHIIESD